MLRKTKTNPYLSLVNEYLIDSPAPVNINYLYNFGSLLGINLVLLIATGIALSMHYNPSVDLAFISSEHILRDVNMGWALRATHANGVSMFFILCYSHIARGLYYGSYKAPRTTLWIVGVIIFIVMMATAFIGNYCRIWFNTLLVITRRGVLRNLSSKREPSLLLLKRVGGNPARVYDNLKDITTQLTIREENKRKAGIYCIYNKINGSMYVGSAITNRINTRFRNH
jgi:hypothetical protein